MTRPETGTTDTALAAAADDWLAVGLATGAADRAAAEDAVRAAYRAAGLGEPRHLVWLGSPLAGALAALTLTRPDAALPDDRAVIVRHELELQGVIPGRVDPGPSVRSALRTKPWATARADASARLGAAGWAQHWAAGGARVWQLVQDRIVTPLRTRLTDQGDGVLRHVVLDAVYGQYDAAWLAAFPDPTDPGVAALAGVARSAGWWWPYADVAILTERPVAVHRDNLGRLHHGDGPALAWPDGFGLHAWRGMPVPPEVAEILPHLTVDRIRAEDNAEIRRVMLEYFGFDRYLRESKAKQVHQDATGILWQVELPGDEPLVMVEVINSTPEPDGTRRTYFLRVPPNVRTAREGVAWTFGLTAEEYRPEVET